MFRIWIDDGTINAWENFKSDTDDFGILTWEFKEPSQSVAFLDLTISIEESRITTKTYQKALNLYHYIMPQSNHPPNMMKCILYSLMRNYYCQNSKYEDYKHMATKLYNRHVNRGWDRATIKQWILSPDVDVKIQQESPQKNKCNKATTKPIYRANLYLNRRTSYQQRESISTSQIPITRYSEEQGASNLQINMQQNPILQIRNKTTDNSLRQAKKHKRHNHQGQAKSSPGP